jgi:autotransporter-associated beta strand protein
MRSSGWLRSFLRARSGRADAHVPRLHRRVRKPWLEILEDRTLLAVNLSTNFVGLDTNAAGGVIEPPDPIAAAGPSTVVEIVNSNIAFYNKSNGQALLSEGLDTFFAPVDSVDSLFSDVYVGYDEAAGRFWVSTMDIDFFNLVSYFDFAVSNDSNPQDGFTEMHQINTTETSPRTGETLFTDFPRVGWNADAYFISFNMFGFQTEYQYNTQLLTIQKSSVLDQNPATLTDYQVDRPLPNSTFAPATMHGASAGGPEWFVEEKGLEQNGSYINLRVVKETNVLSNSPTFTDYYVRVSPYTITPFPGDTLGQVTTALDTRVLNVDWRNNQLAVAQNVGVSSDTDVHARWYLLSTSGTPSLVQQGTIAPGSGVDTYMPSVALGTDGSIGMTYIESSPTENMSMYVTGRLRTDPNGTMQAPVLVKAGELNYQGTRAGDFSSVMVDPSSGTTYWATNEYAITTTDLSLPNWGTWMGEFTLSATHAVLTGRQSTSSSVPQHLVQATRLAQARHSRADYIDGVFSRGKGLRLDINPAHQPVPGRGRSVRNASISLGSGGSTGGHVSPLVVNNLGSFVGLNTNDAGGVIEPPDPIAAAGPSTVVEIVNSNIAFYNKSNGQALLSEGLDTFFAPVDSVDSLFSDVYVGYDEAAGRFWVSTMDIDFFNLVSYFDFAVSNDSNPQDGFTEMHQINTTETSPQTGETLFTDFPRVGWNADAYFISFNMFGFQTQYPYNAQLVTVQKSTVLDQNPATLTYYQVDRPLPNSTFAPATMHGANAGGPEWFVEEKGLEQNGSYVDLRVVKENNVLSNNPTFTDYYVAVAPYTITPFPGDTQGQVTTTLDTRILNVDWRNGQLAVAQDVGIGSDIDVHAAWYLLSTSGSRPTLLQQGAIAPGSGVDTYMPSVALGTDGGIGMTYIESSPTENMSMYVTGRLTTDPSGTMETPVLVKSGEMNYQGTRAGDFSSVMVDPTSGTTYWAANEYAITTTDLSLPNWGTWIAEFTIVHPTDTWTGGGTTTNWSDAGNWSGGVAPNGGDNLVFGPSASNFTSTNDLPAGTAFGSITLSGGGYTISGNSVLVASGIDASGQTGSNAFNLPISFTQSETILAGSGSTDLSLGGTVNNGGHALTVGGGNGFIDFVNTISGAGSFTLNNTGTVTFSGPANTYTGITSIPSGTLVLDKSSGVGIAGNLVVGPGSATVRLEASGQTAGSRSVTINGGGLLDLNGNSDTVGPVTLSAGSITTAAGTLTLAGNVISSGASSISGNLALGSSGTTFTVTSSSLTVSAGISGNGGLTKSGGGTLILTAANSFTGASTLTAGTLTLGNNQALGSGGLTLNGGTLTATGAALSLANNLTLGGNVILGGGLGLSFSGTVTLTGNRTLSVTDTAGASFTGAIGESVPSMLTKNGPGALTLSAADSYSGGTVLTAGGLVLGNGSALGSGTLALNGGTLSATAGALSLGNAVSLGGNVTLGGSSDLTFTAAWTLTGNSTLTVTNTATTTISAGIGESGGSRSLTKRGGGLLVLAAPGSYSGGTVLAGGTLAVGDPGALGNGGLTLTAGKIEANGSPITLANPVTLAGNVTLTGSADLTFTGSVTLTGNRTLSVTNTGTTSFTGVISQSGGTFGLTKAGAGTLVLSGANSYSGTTAVSAGTLVINGSQPGSAVRVSSGAILAGSGTTGALTVSAGGKVMPGLSATQTGILSTGNLTLSSGSTFQAAWNGTTPGTSYDQISASGTVNITGATLNLTLGYTPAVGDSIMLINNNGTGAVVGTFRGLAQNATFVLNGMTFQINYQGGDGNDVVVTRIA